VARVAAPWVLASAYFAADLGAFFAPLSAGGGGGRDAARPAASAGAAAAPALASSSRSTGGCGLDILVDVPDLQLALVEQPRAPDARARCSTTRLQTMTARRPSDSYEMVTAAGPPAPKRPPVGHSIAVC